MKNSKRKDISITDLVNEFHVSKSSLELYGIHNLLLPIPNQQSKPAYRPLDKVRLKFIVRAKNADYTIGNIKELIGALDSKKDEADQMEESLIYCKKKAAELTESLEELDALEQINITCDLELLEAYITDLNKLKYGWNDATSLKTSLPDDETISSHAKPRMPVYSHVTDQINRGIPAITPKKSRIPLIALAGLLLVAISGYVYFGRGPVPDAEDNPALPTQKEVVDVTKETTASSETDEIILSEKGMNSDENDDILANVSESEEESIPLLDFPALKNELDPPPPASTVDIIPEVTANKQTEETKTAQTLLDSINESQKAKTEAGAPAKEDTQEVFFKQLIADLKKINNEKTQSQPSAGNDTVKINATPEEKDSETNDIQEIAAVSFSNDAPQDSKATTPSDSLKETESNSIVAATEPLLKKTTTTKPKKTAPLVVTKQQPSTVTGVTPSSVKKIESPPPVVSKKNSEKKITVSAKKKETPNLPKSDEVLTPPSVPPTAKPRTVPPKPANPEALKWVQKSYESVMRGDAGEAIISASVAITLDPGVVNAYINRSWAYSKKGQYDKAIQDCDKALDIDSDNALAYNNRGLAFQGKGDMDRAKADYERACKLGFDIGCKNYKEVVGGMADNS
jgi:DNA-binding transcriptional MerR regulator